MIENPNTSPADATSSAVLATGDNAERALLPIARTTFRAWEKLHIAYVAILAVITVLMIGPSGFPNCRLLLLTVEGAIVANVAYFAGPTIETYVKWLGYDRSWPRWVMFAGGTLLSIILVVGVLATELLPDTSQTWRTSWIEAHSHAEPQEISMFRFWSFRLCLLLPPATGAVGLVAADLVEF